jgi:hypothetical protein
VGRRMRAGSESGSAAVEENGFLRPVALAAGQTREPGCRVVSEA